jgi:hypothetical protein
VKSESPAERAKEGGDVILNAFQVQVEQLYDRRVEPGRAKMPERGEDSLTLAVVFEFDDVGLDCRVTIARVFNVSIQLRDVPVIVDDDCPAEVHDPAGQANHCDGQKCDYQLGWLDGHAEGLEYFRKEKIVK